MNKPGFTLAQMRELEELGLDTSNASLYLNDVSEDGIDNGQIIVDMHPNDGSRQHEIEHDHVRFIYSDKDVFKMIPLSNCSLTQQNGLYHAILNHRGENKIWDGELMTVCFSIIKYCLINDIPLRR